MESIDFSTVNHPEIKIIKVHKKTPSQQIKPSAIKEKVLETKNIEFINLFFNIWLRKDSQNPKFTNELLGLSKG